MPEASRAPAAPAARPRCRRGTGRPPRPTRPDRRPRGAARHEHRPSSQTVERFARGPLPDGQGVGRLEPLGGEVLRGLERAADHEQRGDRAAFVGRWRERRGADLDGQPEGAQDLFEKGEIKVGDGREGDQGTRRAAFGSREGIGLRHGFLDDRQRPDRAVQALTGLLGWVDQVYAWSSADLRRYGREQP